MGTRTLTVALFLLVVVVGFLILREINPENKNRYELEQVLEYVEDGEDQVYTRVVNFDHSFIGQIIFKKRGTYRDKYKDSLEAVDFIDKYKNFK